MVSVSVSGMAREKLVIVAELAEWGRMMAEALFPSEQIRIQITNLNETYKFSSVSNNPADQGFFALLIEGIFEGSFDDTLDVIIFWLDFPYYPVHAALSLVVFLFFQYVIQHNRVRG